MVLTRPVQGRASLPPARPPSVRRAVLLCMLTRSGAPRNKPKSYPPSSSRRQSTTAVHAMT